MNEHRAKLIKSENSDEEFAVLLDQELGRGGFGVVYRAVDLSRKEERLVVKVVPLELSRREAIESQLKVLRELPPHPNLVRVKPVKCYSDSNYYIFMECCRDGTLFDKLKNKAPMSEQQIMSIFYQLVKGYKVLYDKKILHQDLKPDNVLIDRDCYKLADFGLSIFYEGYKFTNKREGTLNYIAPEKLMKLQYKGNPLSDVYSLGVIAFEMTLGKHPYIKSQGKRQLKSFIQQLKQARLTLPLGFSSQHSLKFLEFFDYVLRMLSKSQSERVGFQQLFAYVENSENFQQARKKQREQSRQLIVEEYHLVVSEVSKVLTVPLAASDVEEKQLRERHELERKEEREKEDEEISRKLYNYVLNIRIVVYFLDRLARRLAVEQKAKGERQEMVDAVIFQLLLLNRSILTDLMQQIRSPKRFTIGDWKKLKHDGQRKLILEIVSRDEGYVEDSTCDFLTEESKLGKPELNELFRIYREGNQEAQLARLEKVIVTLLEEKTKYVDCHRRLLTTIVFIDEALKIVEQLKPVLNNSEYLQPLLRQIEGADTQWLRNRVQKFCSARHWLPVMQLPDNVDSEQELQQQAAP